MIDQSKLQVGKAVVVGAVSLYTLATLFRWTKCLAKLRRSKNLARKLPTPPVPTSAKFCLDFYGWFKRSLPDGKKFNPTTVTENFVTSIQKVHYEHGKDEGLMCLWTLNPRLTHRAFCSIVVWDMEIVRELTSGRMLPKMVKSYAAFSDLIGKNGILASSHEIWHPQRVAVENGFTTDYVYKRCPMISQTAKEMIQKITLLHQKNAGNDGFMQMDIVGDMLRATMDVIGRYAFSYDLGCINDPGPGFQDETQKILNIIQQRMRNPIKFATRNILPTSQNREFKRRIKNIDAVSTKIITERLASTEKRENVDFLDVLFPYYLGDGVEDKATGKRIKFTGDQIMTNVRAVFFGGHNTIGHTLSWSFYLLAKHPNVVQKLLHEFNQNNNDISAEKLETYHYLNAVIMEILRIYPSTPMLKETTEDVTVGHGRYVIPKGVEILFYSFFQQRDPKNFEKPNEFKPERWMEPKYKSDAVGLQAEVSMISRLEAFFPFSLGARNCVGRKLALFELRIFILEMISAFELKLPEKMPEGFQDVPLMGVAGFARDVELKLKPRN